MRIKSLKFNAKKTSSSENVEWMQKLITVRIENRKTCVGIGTVLETTIFHSKLMSSSINPSLCSTLLGSVPRRHACLLLVYSWLYICLPGTHGGYAHPLATVCRTVPPHRKALPSTGHPPRVPSLTKNISAKPRMHGPRVSPIVHDNWKSQGYEPAAFPCDLVLLPIYYFREGPGQRGKPGEGGFCSRIPMSYADWYVPNGNEILRGSAERCKRGCWCLMVLRWNISYRIRLWRDLEFVTR